MHKFSNIAENNLQEIEYGENKETSKETYKDESDRHCKKNR